MGKSVVIRRRNLLPPLYLDEVMLGAQNEASKMFPYKLNPNSVDFGSGDKRAIPASKRT